MSEWKYELLVIVPEGLIQQANHLALLVGTTPADINTFNPENPKVTDGETVYHLAHSRATSNPLTIARTGLPDILPPGLDPVLAAQALASLVIWQPPESMPDFPTSAILAIIEETSRMPVQSRLTSLGLTWLPAP